jgi:hypothetical protein
MINFMVISHFRVAMVATETIVINPFGTVEFNLCAHCTTNDIYRVNDRMAALRVL